MRFLYVMDPMCAWCYGFQPELEQFISTIPNADVEWVMGGLAPDTEDPMAENIKQSISSYWYEIEKRAQVTFNHDYWKLNTPYRSTYTACRAVISAETLEAKNAQKMVKAIQSAYYLEAKNPSLDETLIGCAKSIGLDENQFVEVFKSEQTEQRLQHDLDLTRQLQVRGFPALFAIGDGNRNRVYPLTLGFCGAEALIERLNGLVANV